MRFQAHLLPFAILLITAFVEVGCGWSGHSPRTQEPTGRQGLSESKWWRQLGDSTLNGLVREALKNSPSVEILAARVELARADASRLRAAAQPMIAAQGAAQFGERQEFETGRERADVMRYAGRAEFSWEVDFWGRVNQLRKGARRKVEASEADEEAGRRILVADIARLEFLRRRLYAEEELVAGTLAANNESVERLDEKAREGIIEQNVVDRQRSEGESLEREIEELRRQRHLSELALDRLLGREPGSGDWSKVPSLPDSVSPEKVARTEIIANRPDIHASASRVAATWHLSQAASLDLLPKLRLGALAGGRSMQITPSIDEWIVQVAPSLEVPMWDPVRLVQVKQSQAEAYLAAVSYRDDVLRAIEEAQTAVINVNAQAAIERSAHSSAETLESVLGRTREKFDAGLTSQLEVLEDQRSALTAQRAVLRAREAGLAAWVDLNNAIGA